MNFMTVIFPALARILFRRALAILTLSINLAQALAERSKARHM